MDDQDVEGIQLQHQAEEPIGTGLDDVVGIEIVEEQGLGRGVANLRGKAVDSEGVAIGSARCLTFLFASGHHGHHANYNDKRFLHYSTD